MKVVVYNLGCKVNQYECDSLVNALRQRGYEVSTKLEFGDCYILNTCAVTNEAESKSRQCVARCRKINPNGKIYVCGCASQNNQQQFVDKAGVVYVSGVAKKIDIVEHLDSNGVFLSQLPTQYEDDFNPTIDRTRAYVKIQDGCNNFCSYCLIPYVRGRSRSRSQESIVAECYRLAQQTKEIVLTGIDMSSYGKDINSSLAQLLVALSGLQCRIRLGSLEVNVVNKELLQATKGLAKFCPQFHLSLQSGNDNVLTKMNRHYTTAEYADRVALIREYYPLASITTDLICAFPTETEEEFQSTVDFVQSIKFAQMHIFGYSARKGTIASKYKPLEKSISKARCEKINAIARQSKINYISNFVGKELEVLLEEKQGDYAVGYSREYIRVIVEGGSPNEIVNVCVEKINGEELQGVLV